MPAYNSSFQGGHVIGGTIYANETGTNKSITISFTASCPGSGLDGGSTSIIFNSSCGPSLRSAVTSRRTVNLTGNRASSGALSNVNHQIV